MVVRVIDEHVRAQRRERRQAELAELLVGTLWAAWGVRVELGVLLLVVSAQRLLAGALGEVGSLAVLAGAIALVLAWPAPRRAVLMLLRAMHVRRRWARATID